MADVPCTIQKWLNHENAAICLSSEVRNINLSDEEGSVIEHSDKNWLGIWQSNVLPATT